LLQLELFLILIVLADQVILLVDCGRLLVLAALLVGESVPDGLGGLDELLCLVWDVLVRLDLGHTLRLDREQW